MIRIAMLGDVYLGPAPALALAPDVVALFEKMDLVVANVEGPVTNRASVLESEKCCLRSAPMAAMRLREWGIDVATIANNHMFDSGAEGFEDTRAVLRDAGILVTGAGVELDEAEAPVIVSLGGVRIAILASAWSFVQATEATEKTAGCAPLDETRMADAIERASKDADIVLMCPHWGFCDYDYPTPEQLSLADHLLNAGATAVVGHHSHVVQGVRQFGDQIVAFSLGNFAFAPYEDRGTVALTSKGNAQGVILELTFDGDRLVDWHAYLTIQDDAVIRLDRSAARSRAFARQSEALSRTDYQRHWDGYVRRRFLWRVARYLHPKRWRSIRRETIEGAWIMLKNILRLEKRDADVVGE